MKYQPSLFEPISASVVADFDDPVIGQPMLGAIAPTPRTANRRRMRSPQRSGWAQRLAAALGNPARWEYRGDCVDLGRCTGRCACGHCGLRYLFGIHNIDDGRKVVVGSTCIKNFRGGLPVDLVDGIESDAKRLREAAAESKVGAQ